MNSESTLSNKFLCEMVVNNDVPSLILDDLIGIHKDSRLAITKDMRRFRNEDARVTKK